MVMATTITMDTTTLIMDIGIGIRDTTIECITTLCITIPIIVDGRIDVAHMEFCG